MKRFCQLHGEYDALIMTHPWGTYESPCPKCNEEKVREFENRERDRIRQEHDEWNRRHGISPEHSGVTLDMFIAENESERAALQACRDMVAGKISKVLLAGSCGTGKTMLSCALVRKFNGLRITMFELSSRIRSSYTPGSDESEFYILNSILDNPFICIDEVGRSKGSPAELNWLSYIIDHAHTRRIPLMLITNRLPSSVLPPAQRAEALEYYIPTDVISRFHQDAQIVIVQGRDRRDDRRRTI